MIDLNIRKKSLNTPLPLVKQGGAEITTIHVIDPGPGVPSGRIKENELEREEEAIRPAQELLNEVDPLAEKEGVNIKKEVVEESDDIGKAIIAYAKKNNFDVIIVGTTGMTRAEEVFLGSVANNVIHHAHCPVFAIQ